MYEVIPKNCGFCLYYSNTEKECVKLSCSVGNIDRCNKWKPMNWIMGLYELPVFKDWNYGTNREKQKS